MFRRAFARGAVIQARRRDAKVRGEREQGFEVGAHDTALPFGNGSRRYAERLRERTLAFSRPSAL